MSPVADPGPGVPLTLAEERAGRISDLRYDLHFDIPSVQTEAVRGRATIRFQLKDGARPLALDFAAPAGSLGGVTSGGRAVAATWTNEHVIIPAADLRPGTNEITLEFRSSDAPLNRNPEFLYALFVPARARQAFPVFDQPDLKGRYTVALEIPAAWEALSNGTQISREIVGERATVRFEETRPISTYLFTFAAGRFQVEKASRDGRQLRMLHRETDAAKVARNREAIFDLHAGALRWLERYTGIEYPFGKFEFLLVPSFQFGGMEHPGSIYYNASGLLLDESATQNQKLGRASLIAHETAHMWFGDLVTMRWFNDVWMKEVFANFMAAKIVNPAFPEINHDLRFLYAHYPSAYEVDRTAGTNAIRQRLDNLNEAGSLYGAIIYQKAPIVMRHLEIMLGANVFRDGMKEYLKTHAFGNATWADLIAMLDRRTPEDLEVWSHAWVEEAGRPTITITPADEGKRVVSFVVSQKDPVDGRGLLWSQRLGVTFAHRLGSLDTKVLLKTSQERVGSATQPLYVLPNADGVAYGNVVLDPASRKYLLANLHDVDDDLRRGVVTVTLWEEMLDGRVRSAEMLETLMRALPRERNELTVQRMLGYTQQAYWRWIPAGERPSRAPKLESLLRSGLDRAKTSSLKSAWFNALRDVALTTSTLEWLERVWRKAETVPGLVLAESDYITLAQELAVRGVPTAQAILDQQIARTQNPDRKARMVFVKPALSADQATRDAFYATLTDPVNRRREAWVLEAVAYLHHPLRAQASVKYVRPSLELLRDIQRTGDIFFPKRWMDATLSGHTSPEVAETVKGFVDELPADYPDRLRRIILSSADDLFRSTSR
ncbi:MAG TPA: M1 family aminopeptidase [Vicinamibacterales bacterium]|nr:M1 family aminopeptidase [Vicinamibacterales bacterium]